MKTFLRLSIVAAGTGWVCFALLSAQAPPPRAQPDQDHTQWVENCLKDFESIRAGMTRGQVEEKLPMDGGRQSYSRVRFRHPACGYFKIDVEFALDQSRPAPDNADKVSKVSKPYVERPFSE
jgi:hypothetical protein